MPFYFRTNHSRDVTTHLRPMELNLTNFIENGEFGLVQIGNSKHEILRYNLTPESWLNDYDIDNSPIWRFGNIDFHFENSKILNSITNNYIPEIDGGESIQINDWWIFKNGDKPTLEEVSSNLTRMGLEYKKKNGQS